MAPGRPTQAAQRRALPLPTAPGPDYPLLGPSPHPTLTLPMLPLHRRFQPLWALPSTRRGSSSAGAGVLEVQTARTLPPGLPPHGDRPGGLGRWPSYTCPESRGDIHCSGKDLRGYTSGNGGFGMYAFQNPPETG